MKKSLEVNSGLFRKNAWWLILIVALIILDIFSKILILRIFSEGELFTVIPNIFNLCLIFNKGAAFGVGSKLPDVIREPFFFLFPLIVTVFLFNLLFKGENQGNHFKFGLSLVIGGALGNYLDRLLHGKVVDFLDLYIATYHWPAFNLADSAITVGIVFLLITSNFKRA